MYVSGHNPVGEKGTAALLNAASASVKELQKADATGSMLEILPSVGPLSDTPSHRTAPTPHPIRPFIPRHPQPV